MLIEINNIYRGMMAFPTDELCTVMLTRPASSRQRPRPQSQGQGIILGIDCGTLLVDEAFADFIHILQYALKRVVSYSTVTIINGLDDLCQGRPSKAKAKDLQSQGQSHRFWP